MQNLANACAKTKVVGPGTSREGHFTRPPIHYYLSALHSLPSLAPPRASAPAGHIYSLPFLPRCARSSCNCCVTEKDCLLRSLVVILHYTSAPHPSSTRTVCGRANSARNSDLRPTVTFASSRRVLRGATTWVCGRNFSFHTFMGLGSTEKSLSTRR